MLVALEKLLVLQDRDRKIAFLKAELEGIAPQRGMIRTKATQSQGDAEAARHRMLHLEADRKKLELEVEAKKELIDRYSLQQFQTKKNEEYRALAHEIEMAKQAIVGLEDQQLALMEQGETVAKQATEAARRAEAEKEASVRQLADLEAREENLRKELARLESDRQQLADEVDPEVLLRYQRQRRSKGDRVIVGVDHGVCGGCHVKLPAQVLIVCQADQEIPTCPNCGRILYYTRDMSLVAAE